MNLCVFKKFDTILEFGVSSFHRVHANLVCIVPIIITDDLRSGGEKQKEEGRGKMDASKWKCKHCLCLHPADFAGCGKCLKTRQECEEPLVPWTCRICRTIQPADFKGCGKCLKTRQECEESGR